MNANECRHARQEIDESVLSERLSERVEAHVATCAACGQFRAERKHLRELVGSLGPVAAPPDFDMRLRARIARERSNSRQPFFRFAMTTPAIAVAGLIVVVIAAFVWIDQRKRTGPPESASIARTNDAPATIPSTPVVDNQKDHVNSPIVKSQEDESAPKRIPFRGAPRSSRGRINEVSDSAVRKAESFRVAQNRAGEVSLPAPANPMVISVPDERGGTRTILLPPVTFGSQRLVDNRTPVSLTNRRDW